jgi:outer membrane protein OmpA-like peptidoglycan-associated protein
MKIGLFIFILLQHLTVSAQNLLANGGFEDENICTEYHVNCSPEAWICTAPSSMFYWSDPAQAHGGDHLMAMLAGHSKSYFKRIFIRSRIVCALRKGNQYRLSFFVKSRHPILDSVGVYFSNYDFLFEDRPFHNIVATTYAADAAAKPVKTDTGWQQVVLNYTATGEENFITLGYFAKNDLKGSTGIFRETNFLFLLDDIEMVPLDPKETICPDWKANTDSIYAQNERHEYLDMIIRLFRYDQPKIVPFTSTQLPKPVVIVVRPKPLIDTLIIPDILFATGKATLNANSHPLLDSFCNAISKKSFDSLLIEGHTDSVGTLENNQKLSADRANAVTFYIKQKTAISNDKLIIRYYAFLKPVALNNTAAGRRKNRRVELFVYWHQ